MAKAEKLKVLPLIKKDYKLSYPEVPRDGMPATETWDKPGMRFTVRRIRHEWDGKGHYCGYVRFAGCPLKHYDGYDGILAYVPVHGGLTFAERHKDGSTVYGFDCNHYNDNDQYPVEWVKAECERMGDYIHIATKYEARYLDIPEEETEKRAKLLDKMRAEMEKKHPAAKERELGFGAMINLLGRKL